jgi:phage tail sheath protein FI
MNDRSVSFDSGGAAESTFVSPGLAQNQAGVGSQNSTVFAYKSAVDIMTNPMTVNLNVLTIPGIREPYITDYAAKKTRDYGLAIYLMDIPAYDDSSLRLYDDSTGRPDVKNTASSFDGRALDNNYVASYFPDVFVDDSVNKRRVKVPASIAALAALGLNDRVAYPWFAPAGFNRAALDFVTNVMVRLNGGDRDTLSDVRINPIASFPREGFVIFGQRTLQQAHSALDRVNVRRLLLEVKRLVIDVAMRMTFENNTPSVREKFVKDATTLLGLIQTQQGINTFSVIMNETNNTQADVENNRVNGRIVIVPTRTFEYIAIDFIITNAGVQFV